MNFHYFSNFFLDADKYKSHSQAVIVACFYNPENSVYRLLAFQKWYNSIKHLNHRIVECLIGPDASPQLPSSPYISTVRTESLLWHKEALLNNLIKELPRKFRYVFWLDADVLFSNKNWLVDSVKRLQTAKVIQPFEYCVHLEKNQLKPNWDMISPEGTPTNPQNIWRSFCANDTAGLSCNTNYDVHGHVGFAWGARREVLDAMPLYDRALIGGADHIMAHGAAGHIPHDCITKSFKDDIDAVNKWMRDYYSIVQGELDFTPGYLYHIWHGDIKNRQYLRRIQDFTTQAREITEKDNNGLYVCRNNQYIKDYYRQRDKVVMDTENYDFGGMDIGFMEDMGYLIGDMILSQQYQTSSHCGNFDSNLPEFVVPETGVVEPVPESVIEPFFNDPNSIVDKNTIDTNIVNDKFEIGDSDNVLASDTPDSTALASDVSNSGWEDSSTSSNFS